MSKLDDLYEIKTELLKEYRKLEKENERLKDRIAELEAENKRLQKLVGKNCESESCMNGRTLGLRDNGEVEWRDCELCGGEK